MDARKQAWTAVGCQERAVMMRASMHNTLKHAREMASVSTDAKGAGGGGIGDEWVALISCVAGLQEYVATMEADGQPNVPITIRPSTGQLVAEVFPRGPLKTLFPGSRGEVWLEPGKPATQGKVYREKKEGNASKGGLALVLGAGNQLCVVFLDLLHKLIADDEVVIVKMSPVNDYVGPILEKVFTPFVEKGFLAFVYGGIEESRHLTTHPLVTSIHLTGSKATYDAILATPGVQGKPVTAELGNVTPYIIVPGPWSEADLEYHAKSVAFGLIQNCGHNCITLELVVTAEDWPLRPAFLAALRKALDNTSEKVPYYPGSEAKYTRFREQFAHKQEVCIPGTGDDASAFLRAATSFVNERCFGSLSVGVWIHPETQKQHQEAFTKAIDDLQYGSICVNVPCHILFSFPSMPWGALPGNGQKARESGVGHVHNTLLLDHPVKSVLSMPWIVVPKPIWHADNYALEYISDHMMRCIASFGDTPRTMWYMTRVAAAAMRA
ncbi:Aldehyde/histidinol dehydrogenase [Dunaliella salina]|uniref:Aldehyde/histidinol dehydrogenase n=1 Tax=Dunaliella salina TaxID=3046 RepID=A0ABQ7G160_DUNSA|nr:Aldehyde/histidinol dehydrogenase [Dunaliella salina]|eukprot:KAF5828342.1 Aldehyde/histidinol dehydrogenase [Dunaliella salina]